MSGKKNSIRVVSARLPDFESSITVDNLTYHIQTEDLGIKTCRIASRVYLDGEVVFSRDSDYSHLVKLKDFREKLRRLMENQHKSTGDFFLLEQAGKKKQKSEYFEDVQLLLKKGRGKAAIEMLETALGQFPDEPFLLSYYGCLTAIIRKDHKKGTAICLDAIEKLKASMPFGSEFFYPVFYLNLGRAYVKGGNKKEALAAFQFGLQNDPENEELLEEVRKMGVRKKPPVPFLKRSNPINKYIGMIISKGKKP